MSKQALIYALCHLIGIAAIPVAILFVAHSDKAPNGIVLGYITGAWIAGWVIAGRHYIIKNGTGS